MIDDSGLGIGVQFSISTGNSEDELLRLQGVMNSTEGKLVAQAAAIERATGGMVKIGGVSASISAAGNSATKEIRSLTLETNAANRAGEGMARQLARQVEVFGKTSSEIRNMRAEQKALAAEGKGLTELAGRIRGLNSELVTLEGAGSGLPSGFNKIGTTGKLAAHHMQNLAFQAQDLGVQMFAAAGSSQPLKLAITALVQQGSQIGGIMSQAGIGIRGVGAAFVTMSKGILLATVTNPILLGLAATIGVFAGAVSVLNNTANESAAVSDYAKQLGLTTEEIEKLGGATVTWGDTAKAVFQVAGGAIWSKIGPAVMAVWDTMKSWTSWVFSGVKAALNFVIGGWVGAYTVIKETWKSFPSVLGDLFYSGVNASIDAINSLISKSVNGVNGFISTANGILSKAGLELPLLSAPQIEKANNAYAGAASKFANTAKSVFGKSFGTDYIGAVGGSIVDQSVSNAKSRINDAAKEKGFLDKSKGAGGAGSSQGIDRHAESLARDAEAVKSQIKNLYALSAAYSVSGAEAMIAEARVKAESDAIKSRGDIEQIVSQQIQLSVAQRISDAAKSTAVMREQADAQEYFNRKVASGEVSAERSAELVKDQIADLPLLAALQVAQQRGLVIAIEKATAALSAQRDARKRLRDAEEDSAYNKDITAGEAQIAILREEYRLVGATNAERSIALAIVKATQEAGLKFTNQDNRVNYIKQQKDIATFTTQIADAQRELNEELSFAADKWDLIAGNVQNAASGIADAFGKAGAAIGGLASTYAGFQANRARLDEDHQKALKETSGNAAATAREEQRFAVRTSGLQISLYGDMANAAKGFFNEKSKGYKAIETAEKVFRAVQFALSVRAMAQDAVETASAIAKSGIRALKYAVEAVAKAIASLPFPLNIAAGAATAVALAAIGLSIGGAFGGSGKSSIEKANEGKGTVFGDSNAQSDSIKNAITALKDIDVLMLDASRKMAASLQNIESNIGGFASLLVRNADSINASGGVTQGFKTNGIGSVLGNIPLVGGLLSGLFGTKTTVVGSGLYSGAQSLGSVLNGGFDASYYSDVQKKKKFLGLTTSNKFSTQYTGADSNLENQFTLILRSFNSAILAAAGPLGSATSEIEQRLNGFIVNIGKIDLQGLTGTQIEEKLSAVFGAAADDMAKTAFPLIEQYQKAGEGAFETLVRVTSTLEAVGATFSVLGRQASSFSIGVKLGLADQFESVSALTSAVDTYFQSYYTKEEQAASRTAQLADVFGSLGLTMPSTLASFRALVDAQDLTSSSGLETYATLLKLAPAFADLQAALDGAKSAADIASERTDLQRQLLELQGDTAALRALQLAKLDASNRALQKEIWALSDAKEAAKAADELRKAWSSVGDTIMDEVRRIRGITDAGTQGGFVALQGQFNAATLSARGGDQGIAKTLPALSQALLAAAADAATSRQELDRVQAQTAASLEATYGVISGFASVGAPVTTADLIDAIASSQTATTTANDNAYDLMAARFDELRAELAQLRSENTTGLSTVAANTGSIKRSLDNVTAQSGGDAVSVAVSA